jgi:hypothetical protein
LGWPSLPGLIDIGPQRRFDDRLQGGKDAVVVGIGDLQERHVQLVDQCPGESIVVPPAKSALRTRPSNGA